MFSEAQIQYLEEVLGTSVESFYRAPRTAVAPEVVVLTPSLTAEEQALLDKILASIQLSGHVQKQALADDEQPRFTLSFQGERPGRHGSFFGFPRISQMMGGDADVAARKKETWNLLKLFQLSRAEA